MKTLPFIRCASFFVALLGAPLAWTQTDTGQRIAATQAFTSGCSAQELSGITINFADIGSTTVPSPARLDPEWARIITDSSKGIVDQPLKLVEGTVPLPDQNETPTSQAHSEVAEEDISWTHYTHDFTFKLKPDSPTYDGALTYYNNADGSVGLQGDMEVEWDNASLMDEHEGFQRIWGAVPEFVWPGVGDRVWALGHWIFDCGHPGPSDTRYVRYETEIHPPQALVTYRLYHPALDSFPRDRTSAPSFAGMQSYLPVTGGPQPAVTTFPTEVPLTEADIFVSGNGGGANDLCSLQGASPAYSGFGFIIPPSAGYINCGPGGHTNPVVPVNDRNYVFDIYPPVTDYQMQDTTGAYTMINGYKVYPWTVYPPVPDASLQYRIVDHSTELPAHTCGGNDTSGCQTVAPIICLIDNTTPPPNQSETGCPAVPARPTRLRVILPFNGSNANYFAQSILLGWDDVSSSANNTLPVRTFKVTLHQFTVNNNGAGCCNDGDWRVFLSVGGQWRYISPFFDTNAFNGQGIKAFDGGDNVCNGDALTENGEDDCFRFDNTPFIVSIGQQQAIHVAVGGFIARDVENTGDPAPISLCRNYPGGCDPRVDFDQVKNLAFNNDDRIGTYEFDLTSTSDYSRPNTFTIPAFDCTVIAITGCGIQYTTDFRVEEISPGTPPTGGDPSIGKPNYVGSGGTFITSATPITLSAVSGTATNFQYRFHQQGGPLPIYASTLPFPVHWTSVDVGSTANSADVSLSSGSDGAYDLQYSAEGDFHLLEPRHSASVILDNTAPMTTFAQPASGAQYGHSDTLVLNYSVDDGAGSGVDAATVVPKMDSQTAAQFGTSLANLATIYLESMSLGTHTFSVDASDNLANTGTHNVTFTITVTFDSLGKDVTNLTLLGCISSISQSLSSKISAAQSLYAKGQIQTSINVLQAAIYEVQAQAGKHIATTCGDPSGRTFNPVTLLVGDIQYLETSIAGQLRADPVLGWVVNSSNAAVTGATVNLMTVSKTIVATAITDAAGFYYFADVSRLVSPSNYILTVTLPKGYKTSSPASTVFTWSGTPVRASFSLN